MHQDTSPKSLAYLITSKLEQSYGCRPSEASPQQLYRAVATSVQHILAELRVDSQLATEAAQGKEAYYMSMEFLLGPTLINHINNLGLNQEFQDALKMLGEETDSKEWPSLQQLAALEPDPGLGNGGLGRLAACYMDSLASLAYPVHGYSIKYEFGIFKQKLRDGWQTEMPDDWLEGGDVWLIPRNDESIQVKLGGHITEEWTPTGLLSKHEGYDTITALPYDVLVSGNGGQRVNVLRLWEAKSPVELDMDLFSKGDYLRAMEKSAQAETITKVLYPADDHESGKLLRLKQQYLLVSASIQDIVNRHISRYGNLTTLTDKVAIHINDTHAAMGIPEMMRILMDEHNYGWDDAWNIVKATFAYTNHTVMSEALERWPHHLVKAVAPRIWAIICEIDRRLKSRISQMTNGDNEKINAMGVIGDWDVRMANLCLAGSHIVNGVSKLHTDILTNRVFADYSTTQMVGFTNVTNGIAHRRWLCQANPGLSNLITELIGHGYVTQPMELARLVEFTNNISVLDKMTEIKLKNKERLVDYITTVNGVKVDALSLFDVQVKRLHEYKRQLLCVLYILHQYLTVLDSPNVDIYPRTFIFAAKASPGYYMAKQIIRLINKVSDMVNQTPGVRDKIKVIFIQDYDVSKAQLIMPAAEVSEQISVAGKEASGTGNMKLMMNGAVTIGTMDGANVEMFEAVGPENMFIFGLSAQGVEDLWRQGYNAKTYHDNDSRLIQIVNQLRSGIAGTSFNDIADYLIYGWGGPADPYMCLADFDDYVKAQSRVQEAYRNPMTWNKMSLINIAQSGRFSADVSVLKYAEQIWNLAPVPISEHITEHKINGEAVAHATSGVASSSEPPACYGLSEAAATTDEDK